jgi:phosphoglycerate kinase
MKKITELTDLRGKNVIVRASLNVPVAEGVVTNEYRIMRMLPTLRYLHEHGAKTVIMGHIGRDPEETLKPVLSVLEKFVPVQWGGSVNDERSKEHLAVLPEGHFLLVENLRQDEREKRNDEAWGAHLATFGEVYVNDAFDNAHREHASMVQIPKHIPAYAGLTLIEEIENLSKVMEPQHPSLFMIGGAKFETKMPLVEKYLGLYDQVFVSGALMNDIFKAKGFEVGTSLVSDVDLTGAAFLENEKLLLPVDVVVNGPSGRRTCKPDEVAADEAIMDAGPETVAMLKLYIEAAKTILWNGPFGNFEGGFAESTEETVKILAESEAFSVVGGGDTVAAIDKLGLNDQLGFVSTGGGAMLTLLEQGTTPALEALE